MPDTTLQPGRRVRVTQQIPQRARVWTTSVTGEVVRLEQRKTGSWFAHSKDDRLWLDRLILRKDDGELVSFILDEFTHVDLLPEPKPEPAASAPTEQNPADKDATDQAAEPAPSKDADADANSSDATTSDATTSDATDAPAAGAAEKT